MTKRNKIIVCLSSDDNERRRMVQKMAVKCGLATTPGDALKIMKLYPQDFDLANTYFVLAERYDLNSSHYTTHELYKLALQGIAVIVGARRIQQQFEFMCEIINQNDL